MFRVVYNAKLRLQNIAYKIKYRMHFYGLCDKEKVYEFHLISQLNGMLLLTSV